MTWACAAAILILVGWHPVTGEPAYLHACPVQEVLASPEWATVVRNRNAHDLAAARAAQLSHAGVVPPTLAQASDGTVPAVEQANDFSVHPPAGLIEWRPEVERWRPLIADYFEWSDVDHALAVVRCESLGDPDVVNDDSSDPAEWVYGLFQHKIRYWPARSAAAGWAGADILDPEANVAVAAWLVYEDTGWGHFACEWYACEQGVC